MLLGYNFYKIENLITNKEYKNEEDRQQIIKFCLSSPSLSYKALHSGFPVTKKEFLQLKWKALRDSSVCAIMLIDNDEKILSNKDDKRLALEVVIESYEACLKLIEYYPIYDLDEKTRLEIINTAVLYHNQIYSVLNHLNNDDRLYILKFIKEQAKENKDLIDQTSTFMMYGKNISQEVNNITFDIILTAEYNSRNLAYNNKLSQEQLKIVYEKHHNFMFQYAQDNYKDSRDIDDITRYLKLFKDFYSTKEEKFLILKLMGKRNYEKIDKIISENKIRQETIDKLHAIKLLKHLAG